MKCCYENITKFHTNNENLEEDTSKYDFFTAIPFGKKYIIWFTIYNNKKACFLLVFDSNKKVKFIKKIFVPFTNDLIYSVFYGTNFYIKGREESFICLEDVLYYKEKDVTNSTELEKLNIFQMIFTNKNFSLPDTNNNYNNVIGLPLMNRDKSKLLKEIELLPYKTDMIICKNFNVNSVKKYCKLENNIVNNRVNKIENKNTNTNDTLEVTPPVKLNILDIINKVPTKRAPFLLNENELPLKNNFNTKEQKQQKEIKQFINKKQTENIYNERVFIVKPDIQNDIYHLYTFNNDKEEYYETAYIPTYTTSVMMNRLFRNIKENENLDRLEESDDEDEFENNNIDKFVYLEKSYKMKCRYNYKFKKWFPVSVI
jgi:hypothetical protein